MEYIWFKLDYIWALRYKRIKDFGISYIIDVWANKGQTIEKYHRIFGKDMKFHSFEPLHSAFSILQSKFSHNPNVRLYNMWLWSQWEEMKINVFSHDDSSSLLKASTHGEQIYKYHIDNTEEIHIDTLDNVFSEWISGIGMMKIDVQWYELKVLQWWVWFIHSSIKVIILELSFIELYSGQELFGAIYDRLTKEWFEYAGALEQAWNPSNGKPVQQDAIFVNKNL